MDKSTAIEHLKQALAEIPHLSELHYDNQEFTLWCDKARNIITAALDTDDVKRFSSWRPIHARGIFRDDVYREDYLKKLEDYETALKSIIQKYELLGIEEEPVPRAGLPETYENYGGRIVGGEFEVIVQGTVDMTIEYITHSTKKLDSQGHAYKVSTRIGDHPDWTRPDRTCSATRTITEATEGTEEQIGIIKLQLQPRERTLLKTSPPKEWPSSFKFFLHALFEEFQRLGYLKGEKPVFLTGQLPKAFIAHEGETEQLKRLKDFLDALGIKYLIAEVEASDGRSIERQVDWT